MFLATHIKDMSPEEFFAIFQPVLYLLPLALVCIVAFFLYRLWKKFALKRLFTFMDREGVKETEKREYLKNYLMGATNSELIHHKRTCRLCAKQFSLQETKTNDRGDLVEEWRGNRCPYCNMQWSTTRKDDLNLRYFILERTATSSPKEAQWQADFEKLCRLNDYYKPYIDDTSDPSDGNITVTVEIR